MSDQAVRNGFEAIFRETFFGVAPGADGTYYVNGGECLFEAFSRLSAEHASVRVGDGVSTVAAHLDHACYYLKISNAFSRGEEPDLDWEGSWKRQSINEEEWSELRSDFEAEMKEAISHAQKADLSDPDVTASLFANVAHAAFHLGAVRQLICLG